MTPNTQITQENVECDACEGSGKIVEAARYHGANQHSACQMDCEDCDGAGHRPALSPPAEGEVVGADAAWTELCERDDRASPEEYPDMCLITRDELADFMSRATPTPAPVDWNVVGPKLLWLIERVDAERKRETVRLNHLKRAVAAVAAEARAALAAAQPQSNGE